MKPSTRQYLADALARAEAVRDAARGGDSWEGTKALASAFGLLRAAVENALEAEPTKAEHAHERIRELEGLVATGEKMLAEQAQQNVQLHTFLRSQASWLYHAIETCPDEKLLEVVDFSSTAAQRIVLEDIRRALKRATMHAAFAQRDALAAAAADGSERAS